MTEQELKKYRTKYRTKCGIRRIDKIGNKIEMRLTFEQWLQIWIDSGHINQMGSGRFKYVMCRKNDIGHYEIDNVFIDSGLNNIISGWHELSDEDRRINELVLKTGYKRRDVRNLIKQGKLTLGEFGDI